GVAAERVYAPAQDFETILRNQNIPLCSLESCIPINQFDIVGFTLQNETGYTNVLNMLDLAKIPLFSREREKKHPLVIAGGPCVFNPEPMHLYFDAFVIGDGEEVVIEIAEICKNWREKFSNRHDVLRELVKIKGVYIPEFYTVKNSDNFVTPLFEYVPQTIEKRIFTILDKKSYPNKFLVPHISIVHDRAILEISRGCSRGCRFCQAGIIYRPVRHRTKKDIIHMAKELIKNTGYDELSLASLCAGDFPCLESLVKELIYIFKDQKVSLALPSQRLDNFSSDTARAIENIRKTGLTFAPEAATQRLRDVINKGITDEDLIRTIEGVFKNGWRSIKLYFMIGLPTEKDEDITAIRDLVKELYKTGKKASGGGVNINITVSPFIPKSHTPFQWLGQEKMEILREKMKYLRQYFHNNIKFQPVEMSFLESVLARGTREISIAIKKAWENGAKFDSWDKCFRFDVWQNAFIEQGLNMNSYANQKLLLESTLPWEHISTGVSKEFLIKEYNKAYSGEKSNNCHHDVCQICGMENICQKIEVKKSTEVRTPDTEVRNQEKEETDQKKEGNKFNLRIKYSKTGKLQYISHLSVMRLWDRAFRRSGLPVAFSNGFNPKILFSFGTVLPVGTTSISEYLDIKITRILDINIIKEKLVFALPEDISIIEINYCKSEKSLMEDIIASSYIVKIPKEICMDEVEIKNRIDNLLSKNEILIENGRKSLCKRIEIKREIINLSILPSDKKMVLLYIRLSLCRGEGLRPKDVLKYMFNFTQNELINIKIERKEVFFKDENRNKGLLNELCS
ncbi:MAG: TIGR03960 family B12-binding radical SAM protein, partial [Candidatus Firestonebacteria bacterium]|nr:TIGR03960 family B12-binding radical SAM protein [Candidatus Firestonebacteria bacterium]